MKHKLVLPVNSLTYLIRHFIFLEQNNQEEAISDKYIPDGSISFVFNFPGEVSVVDGHNVYKVPPCFMISPLTKSLQVNVINNLQTMVVVCKASVFTRVFQIELDCNQILPYHFIDNIIPAFVIQQMKSADNLDIRKTTFEDYVLGLFQQDYVPDEIDRMYERIMSLSGVGQINQLLMELDLNPRSFRRKFISRVGVGAKALSRIARINFLWSCHLQQNCSDYQSMVFDGKFHDQSHLINDFKKIIGESPSRFFKRDQEKMQFISGKYIK